MMASLVHEISDSEDSDDECKSEKTGKYVTRGNRIQKSISMQDLFGGSEDETEVICTAGNKRKRSISDDDSDRTIDPDEEPRKFRTKSGKKLKKRAVSDTDSDVTVDYSPERIAVSDTDSEPQLVSKVISPSKTTKGYYNAQPKLNKSLSKDHIVSDSDSEGESLTSNVQTERFANSRNSPNATNKTLEKLKQSSTATHGNTSTPMLHQRSPKEQNSRSSAKRHKNFGESSSNHKNMATPENPERREQQLHSKVTPNSKQQLKKAVKKADSCVVGGNSDDSDATVDLEEEPIKTEPDRRPMCRYGSKCYRKNPSHFAEFQHPGKDPSTPGPSTSTKKTPSRQMSKKSSTEQTPASSKHQSKTPENQSQMPRASTAVKAIVKKPDTPADVVEDGGELGLFLTKVSGIESAYNDRLAMDIKDILSPSMGKLVKSAQFNYMTDIPWLVQQYPPEFRQLPLLIVHGCQRAEKAALDQEASVYSHVRLCQARLDIMYGTHHTKMMLLVYDNGMRVVIHTANLIHNDWHQKTQGIWISPLFPKLSSESSTAGDSPTHFKRDLLEYLSSYRARPLEEWTKAVREHDMSGAKVFIIASTPGRHTGEKKSAFGHLKLRKVLQTHGPTPLHVKNWPMVGQFSSIGSLGANKDLWVCGEWLSSLSTARDGGLTFGDSSKLKLVFPSKDNVRLSLEGYPAGGSLPYSINTAKKQSWLHAFFHQWRSSIRGRSRASPHIKTYLRASPDWQNIAWFLVTSANLSKAAWGALEKNAQQLMIRSYEIGVLFLPTQFGTVSSFRPLKNLNESLIKSGDKEQMTIPLPYDLPLTEYNKQDRPWVWDIQYRDLPDSNGNMWCPT